MCSIRNYPVAAECPECLIESLKKGSFILRPYAAWEGDFIKLDSGFHIVMLCNFTQLNQLFEIESKFFAVE